VKRKERREGEEAKRKELMGDKKAPRGNYDDWDSNRDVITCKTGMYILTDRDVHIDRPGCTY
jgi:hypothetical protein